MKQILLSLLLICSMGISAQDVVVTRQKKQQTTTTKPKQYTASKTKQQSTTSSKQQAKSNEVSGYEVSFSCNVPNAVLYIDGTNYGSVNGKRYLKTGYHSIRLSADGYEDTNQSVNIGPNNLSFYFSMKQLSINAMYDKGYNAFKQQNYSEALKWFRKAAEQGHSLAQFYLGYCYEHGKGVAQSSYEAAKWYRKGAEQGEVKAQEGLAFLYFSGRGVAKSYSEAFNWAYKAAAQGHARSQQNIAFAYLNGLGVAKDKKKAIEWYRKAAANGDSKSKQALVELGYY